MKDSTVPPRGKRRVTDEVGRAPTMPGTGEPAALAQTGIAGPVEAARAIAGAVTVASGDGDVGPAPDAPARGERIDRFVVLDRIGAGGMAVVVSAYDPTLDRRVAIKLMRPEVWRGQGGGSAGRQLLVREAQAMARLQHPNVVTVHEVGTRGDEVYLAMEYVDGVTLRAWLAEAPRTWREIVDVFVQAGRGVVAAHHAGLVHRDLKPENVLIGRDGRARVTDFGLVTTGGREDTPLPDGSVTSSLDGGSGMRTPLSLTRTGALLGTPAYMAPEQLRRRGVDARTDQFAFCVALWEALHGERPFAGDTPRALLDAIVAGAIREPATTRVPARLRDALRRGLAADPDRRWPSLEALLDALDDAPEARRAQRRRTALVATAFVGVAAVAVFALVRGPAPPRPCAAASAGLEGVWDDRVRGEVQGRFAATGRSYAADTFDRTAALLDAYADGWRTMRIEACEATHVRQVQSAQALDLRTACLDRRRAALASLSGLLREASVDVLDQAIAAASRLPAIAGCADVDALAAAIPPPADPDARAAIAAATDALDRVDALELAGQVQDAAPIAAAAVADARRLAWPPLLARALTAHGTVLHALGQDADAEPVLREAIRAATIAHDDPLVVRGWIARLDTLAALDRADDALAHREAAELALARAGDPAELRAALWTQLGTVLWGRGRLADAEALLDRALALRIDTLGPDHRDVAAAHESLGNTLADQGRYPEARRHLERSVAIHERADGPRHPRTGAAHNDLGLVLRDLGEFDAALDHLRIALAVHEEVLGEGHADVGRILNNVGLAHAGLGQLEPAERALRRSLAIKEAALGERHASTVLTLQNLAAVLIDGGHLADARPLLERVLATFDAQPGEPPPDAALARNTLAAALRLDGNCAEAVPHYQAARRIWERALGADHYETANAYFGLGACALAQGRLDDAVRWLERAAEIRGGNPGREAALAEVEWHLGRALYASGRDRARGRALVERARAVLATTPSSAARELPAIDAWLARHAP